MRRRRCDPRDTEWFELAAQCTAAGDGLDLRHPRGGQRLRQLGWGKHPPPRRGLEIVIAGFGDRRHVRNDGRSDLARDGERAQPAGLHIGQHRLQRVEHDLDLAADHVGDTRGAALVGHVLDVDAGDGAEHLGGKVPGVPTPAEP